ncbi:hypothetical protein GcM3_098028, partial [Golovinomyces cichoracearum]
MIDDREQSTREQVVEFKEHLSARFPSYIIDYSEENIQHDIKAFSQALAPVEQVVLNSIISALVEGLQDEDLRNEVFSRSILSCGSLWRSVEIIKETQQSLNLAREAKNRSAEKQEIQQIRALCAARFGKSVTSVLADLSPGNLALSRARTGRESDAETIPQRQQAENPEIQSRVAPETSPEKLQKIFSRELQPKANEQQLPLRGYQGRESKNPLRNISRNPFVNGSALYNLNDGPLCFGCGMIGHIKSRCSNNHLQNWEQSYLKDLLYNRAPVSREANIIDYGNMNNRWSPRVDSHSHLNPHYDLHQGLRNQNQHLNQPTLLRPSSSSSQISEVRPDRSSQPWRPQKVHFGQQDDAEITLEQLHGLVLSDDQEVTNESKTCELGLQFNSFSSSGPSKKRQRVELEDLLNKTTAVPTEPP